MKSAINLLKELYGNPTKPEYVIAKENNDLSELEEMLYKTDIEKYYNDVDSNVFTNLIYKDNPFLKMIRKGDEFQGNYIPVLIDYKEKP